MDRNMSDENNAAKLPYPRWEMSNAQGKHEENDRCSLRLPGIFHPLGVDLLIPPIARRDATGTVRIADPAKES